MAAMMTEDSHESLGDSRIIYLYNYLSNNLKGFIVNKCIFEGLYCLVLTHERLFSHPPVGPTSRVRILVKDEEYIVQVLLREVERGSLSSISPEKELFQLCLKYASDSTVFKFCPGINATEYEIMKGTIRFDVKSIRKTQEPFIRVDSVKCALWFQLGTTCRSERRSAESVLCQPCVRLKCDIQHQFNRTESESPTKKLLRQGSSSRARLSYMSPTSREKRKSNQLNERKNLKKLLHYEETAVALDDHQDSEMLSITSIIHNNCQEELGKLYSEG